MNKENERNKFMFTTSLLDWFSIEGRKLPWRYEIVTAYEVVVSEFMLQQTQVPRVVDKFLEFMNLFPTIQDLAAASKADVIKAWSGLGYNRRALLLHAFAQEVCEQYGGEIPSTSVELIRLPGIGPYTAGSIASFAFNKPDPAIDVNVRRIYTRYFDGKDQGMPMGKNDEQQLFELVRETIPEGRSRDFHGALMDFGSMVCLRHKPPCLECPLRQNCNFFPKYEQEKEKVLFVMEKKQEQGRMENGKFIPNRIFRGRIVEFARQNEAQEFSFADFGRMIKLEYSSEDEEWLRGLCIKLQQEGMITFQENNDLIMLHIARS